MIRKSKKEQRDRRRSRIRSTISGTAKKPRLAIFKSNKYINAQAIDDSRGTTLVSLSSKSLEKGTPTEKAAQLGKDLAKSLKEKKVDAVVFDRGGFIFTGQVKALADGAREAGIKF
ncbi:MAG: 50S ribosomal protein L18 [Candidatus Pacebacteria bacterium]|nr:50S ribosomal protein L18 [Candidatus Paceibacterota bacterium]